MSAIPLNPRFHQHFDPRSWEKEACVDLVPVLRWILLQPDARIAAMGLENIKMPDFVVLLDWQPGTAEAEQLARLCAENPNLRLHADVVLCFDHYSSIEWRSVPPPPPAPEKPAGFWTRFFAR